MYHRDYTDFPEDFAHEMTYKRYCKAIDEREKAEDARYTLENMVYPHFDIDDIDQVEDADLEWMNLDAGELEDIIYGEADQEGGETRSQMEEKKPIIDRILYSML